MAKKRENKVARARQGIGGFLALIAVGFLVRDGAGFLDSNLQQLVTICKRFRRFRAFYVENDSSDGTPALLRRFAREYPQFTGLHLRNASRSHSAALCPKSKSR